MSDKRDLRDRARALLSLAQQVTDMPLRLLLLDLAAKFAEEAARMDIGRPLGPPGKPDDR